jgi:hypothetical protein
MHGCCLGNFPWGHLGQDSSGQDTGFTIPGQVGVDGSGDPIDADGNVLNPDGSIFSGSMSASSVSGATAGQLATVASGGSTGNPALDTSIAQLIAAAGGATQTVLKQVQLGQIASNVPITNTALQAAIIGGQGGSLSAGLSSVVQTLTQNPMLLLVGVAAIFILRKK